MLLAKQLMINFCQTSIQWRSSWQNAWTGRLEGCIKIADTFSPQVLARPKGRVDFSTMFT